MHRHRKTNKINCHSPCNMEVKIFHSFLSCILFLLCLFVIAMNCTNGDQTERAVAQSWLMFEALILIDFGEILRHTNYTRTTGRGPLKFDGFFFISCLCLSRPFILSFLFPLCPFILFKNASKICLMAAALVN